MDINRNIMGPNSSVEQFLTKNIPTYINLSESQYNKMDNTILLEYKLFPIDDARIIFNIDNERTDSSISSVQYVIISNKL